MIRPADLVPFFVAFVVAAVASPFVMKALVAAKSRQNVSKHIQEHAHKQGTPTMGGIIILVGWVAGSVAVPTAKLWPALATIVLFALIGYIDDFLVPRLKTGSRGLSWGPKLAMQVVAALPATLTLGSTNIALVAGMVVWVLFYANAFNFSDGLDNLSGGIAMWTVVGVQALSVGHLDPVLTALFGAVLPFMVWNAPPAKVFMGDVGSLPIGAYFGLATFSLAVPDPATFVPKVAVLAGMMFAMIVPVVVQIGGVKVFKRRLLPFKTPVHHGFQEKGWDEPRIVRLFHVAQILCSAGAVAIGGVPK
ncbi:MAG: hypothetical protein KF857_00370 [Fimbriimonadaceae bacterium]|nr:hypothetical protein [Fimbriimonadaceae bacterium]